MLLGPVLWALKALYNFIPHIFTHSHTHWHTGGRGCHARPTCTPEWGSASSCRTATHLPPAPEEALLTGGSEYSIVYGNVYSSDADIVLSNMPEGSRVSSQPHCSLWSVLMMCGWITHLHTLISDRSLPDGREIILDREAWTPWQTLAFLFNDGTSFIIRVKLRRRRVKHDTVCLEKKTIFTTQILG